MTRTIQTGLTGLALLVLGACSGAGDGTPAVTAAAPAQDLGARPPDGGDAERGRKAAAGPGGDCDLLSVTEIEQAFGNRLRVKRVSASGTRGSGCTVSIAEGADSQLVFQAGGRADYDARKEAYLSQSRIRREPVPIGAEAFLVNGGQVIAVDADGRSISVGLMLLVFDGNAPATAAEVAAGVQSLAQLALERL